MTTVWDLPTPQHGLSGPYFSRNYPKVSSEDLLKHRNAFNLEFGSQRKKLSGQNAIFSDPGCYQIPNGQSILVGSPKIFKTP